MENSWTIEQTKKLFLYVKAAADNNKGLKAAFEKVSDECGRSINSVRNYYYSQLKMFELVPSLAKDLNITVIKSRRDGFDLFTEKEITDLVSTILCKKAQGHSVRAIIAGMAKNPKEALRLQNKYRSMIAHNRAKIEAVMSKLNSEGKVYFNPYFKEVVDGEQKNDNLLKLNEYISRLDASEVGNFLNILSKLK